MASSSGRTRRGHDFALAPRLTRARRAGRGLRDKGLGGARASGLKAGGLCEWFAKDISAVVTCVLIGTDRRRLMWLHLVQ